MKNNTSRLIITILSITTIIAILLGLYIHVFSRMSAFGGITVGKSKGVVSDTVTFEGSVTEIDLIADFANVTVEPGNGPLTVSYTMPKEQVPVIEFDNGELTITRKKGVFITNNFLNTDYSITVTVPAGTDLSSLKLNADAGNIKVSDLNAKNVSIDTDAGNVSVRKITATTISINTDAGNLDLDELTADKLSLDTDAGNIDLKSCNVGTFDVDLDAGNLEMYKCVIDSINADTDMGNIEASESEIRSGSCTTDMGDIDLKGDIGNVNVKTSLGKVR